jgi:two-component system, NtrC family, response regulator GlrR
MPQEAQASPRILLVDGRTRALERLSARLAAAGFEVVGSTSQSDALGRLTAARPDLVVVDFHEKHGVALLDEIRRQDPVVPVIVLAGNNSISAAVAATRKGAYNFLAAPVDGGTLIGEIRRALELSVRAEQVGKQHVFGKDCGIISRSRAMRDLLREAQLVAESEVSVLLRGDSGTGKELVARAIHQASVRRERPFVPVNCSAIPADLLESELFGHRKGAFTGATRDHTGLFAAANGGTLFLDEIGDMPVTLQPKLLRVLETRQVRRLGSTSATPVDVRIISATHQDLERKMLEGEFREDLYYRLNVVTLELPTLAQRKDDIPLLAGHFLARIAAKYGKDVRGFSPEALELLAEAPWPGNVRQLLNVVEHVVTLAPGAIVPANFVEKALRERRRTLPPLTEARRRFERQYLTQLMQITSGNVSQAARLAKRNRTEFYKLLHRYALDPALFKVRVPNP